MQLETQAILELLSCYSKHERQRLVLSVVQAGIPPGQLCKAGIRSSESSPAFQSSLSVVQPPCGLASLWSSLFSVQVCVTGCEMPEQGTW